MDRRRPLRADPLTTSAGAVTPASVVACGLLAVGLGSVGAWERVSAATNSEAELRYDGEYGLYVGLFDGGFEVRWLTPGAAKGVARVLVDDVVVAEETTAESSAHLAEFEIDAPNVVVEFGMDEPGGLYRIPVRLSTPAPAEIEITAPESVYVFGDVHGEFDRIVTLLEGSELIDSEHRWIGGAATVALLGDLFDRGDDVTRLLWFLYALEPQAEAAGGRIVVVLGNHEVMVMSGDLRYVSPKETNIGALHGLTYAELFHPRSSVLGRWLASKPGLVRMDDLLLAHGGVSPTYTDYSLRQFQDSLEAFIAEPLFVHWEDRAYLEGFVADMPLDSAAFIRRYEFFFNSQSVLWYRDLVLTDTLGSHLDTVLERFDSDVHVVAHTPVQTIQERYDGKLIAVDLLDAAGEMLLLVRSESGGWDRWKVPLEGSPVPLDLIP